VVQCDAVWCSVLQCNCVAVWCSVLQCVAVCVTVCLVCLNYDHQPHTPDVGVDLVSIHNAKQGRRVYVAACVAVYCIVCCSACCSVL